MPLDFPELTDTLIIAWLAALIYAPFMMAIARYQGKLPRRPILSGVLQFLCFGNMLTIFGIALRASDLGLISYRLYLFIILSTALAVGCSGWAGRLWSPPEA